MHLYLEIKKQVGCLGILLLAHGAQAQFSSGSSFFVTAGTALFVDSLTLQPDVAGISMVNTTISVSQTPIPAAGISAGSIQRVYTIDPAISLRGTAGIYYRNTELNGNTPASLAAVYDDGSNGFGTLNLTTSGNNNNYVTATTGTATITLKRITSVDAGTPLPLDLLSFDAFAVGETTAIEWTTANEHNCAYFVVQRSSDGLQFDSLLFHRAEGSGPDAHLYTSRDERPFKGWNYYRLQQVDIDGGSRYSKVAPVFFGKVSGAEVMVYPNPASSSLHVVMKAASTQTAQILLMDVSGRIIEQKELSLAGGSGTQTIDVSHLSPGVYLVKVGSEHLFKIIRE